MSDYGDPMPGIYENAKIISHKFIKSRQKGTPGFEMEVEINTGFRLPVTIWISPKAMGMARRAFKLCGFDPDAHSLEALKTNSRALVGVRIPAIDVEVNDYGVRGSVVLDEQVDDALLRSLDAGLRSAKNPEEAEPAVSPRGPEGPARSPHPGLDEIPF